MPLPGTSAPTPESPAPAPPPHLGYVEDIICTSFNYGILLAELTQYDLAEKYSIHMHTHTVYIVYDTRNTPPP